MPYLSYKKFLSQKFGQPVLKIPVNGGFSCPNRDGTKSSDGCVFCDNQSFSPVAFVRDNPVDQLQQAILSASKKFSLFLPYLQPFSNTYGPVEQLSAVYEPIIATPGVVGLAIGTRPDCFSSAIYDYLKDVSQRTYISVELGVQTSHDSTLELINRHHSFADVSDAVDKLHERGIEVVAHIMLGLPGESRDMILQTAKAIASLPFSGVKIHQTMVIKNTILEELFNKHEFSPLSLEEYASLVSDFIAILKPGTHIHRLMADCRIENGLVAPLWSAEKMRALRVIDAAILVRTD